MAYDNILFMHLFLKHITRALVLPFFLMYALSPVYLSGINDDSAIADLQSSDKNVMIGFVWLSFVLDSIVPDNQSRSTGSDYAVEAEQNEEMILIKKKRVLTRESYKVDPIFQVATAEPIRGEKPLSRSTTFDVPCDLIHSHTDGYYSLSTGLSPPPLLS